jgi:predicted dehydrogenase
MPTPSAICSGSIRTSDLYLETPLTVTIREGRQLADAVKKTGRVLQVGSQQRTMEVNRFACEFIRNGGMGRISKVELPNYPGPRPMPPLEEELKFGGVDFNLFAVRLRCDRITAICG